MVQVAIGAGTSGTFGVPRRRTDVGGRVPHLPWVIGSAAPSFPSRRSRWPRAYEAVARTAPGAIQGSSVPMQT